MTAALLPLLLAASAVRVEPASLTFGPEAAPLVFTAPGATALRVSTNGVGALSAVERAGPDAFRARFTFPTERFPQVVLLAVEAKTAAGAWRRHWLALPLWAGADLKIETKPRAKVTVAIGPTTHGPIQADAKGRLTLKARVPPGVAAATVVAVDKAGNSTTTPLPLPARPYPRAALALAAPAVAAGQQATLELFAVEPDGAPLGDAGALRVGATLGACAAPFKRADGVFDVPYRAPRSIAGGRDTVTASVEGSPQSLLEVPLVAGAAAAVAVTLTPPEWLAGSGAPVRVAARFTDEHGNDVAGAPLAVSADFGRVEETGAATLLHLPDVLEGRTVVRVRATSAQAAGEAVLRLRAGPPKEARLELPPRLSAGEAMQGRLLVRDAWGNPVEPTAVGVVASSGQPVRLSAAPDGSLAVAYDAAAAHPPGPLELEVRAGERQLSRGGVEVLPFERPWAVVVGAGLAGSWNLASARAVSPRLSLGLRLGRTSFELGAEGAFAYYPHADGVATVDGSGDVGVDVSAFSVAAAARYSLRLSALLSVHVALAAGVQQTSSAVARPGGPPVTDSLLGPLVRGGGGVAVHALGGRLLAQLEYGYAPAPTGGHVRGNLGGAGLALGYAVAF